MDCPNTCFRDKDNRRIIMSAYSELLREFYQDVAIKAGTKTLMRIASTTGDERLNNIAQAIEKTDFSGTKEEVAAAITQATTDELATLMADAMTAAANKAAEDVAEKSAGILSRIWKAMFGWL